MRAWLLGMGLWLAAGPAAAVDFPPPGDRVQGVRISRPTLLRVDDATLVTARDLRIDVSLDDGGVTGILLVAALDRVDVDRLRPPRWELPLDRVAILTLDPDRPVLLFARAREELVAALRARGVDAVTALMELDGPAGFPLLLDLGNYAFADLVQETPADGEEGR